MACQAAVSIQQPGKPGWGDSTTYWFNRTFISNYQIHIARHISQPIQIYISSFLTIVLPTIRFSSQVLLKGNKFVYVYVYHQTVLLHVLILPAKLPQGFVHLSLDKATMLMAPLPSPSVIYSVSLGYYVWCNYFSMSGLVWKWNAIGHTNNYEK